MSHNALRRRLARLSDRLGPTITPTPPSDASAFLQGRLAALARGEPMPPAPPEPPSDMPPEERAALLQAILARLARLAHAQHDQENH